MRESTNRVESALRGDNEREQLLAHRILENPRIWQSWESEHSMLMRHVAEPKLLRGQVAALKHTSLRLVHGKALFEYLRQRGLRGAERHQILQHFHPTSGHAQALVAEHGLYLRKACSFMCASHLGTGLVEDPAFLDPLQQYENLYTEYFNLYCDTLFESDEESSSQGSLLPLLKHQLNEWRWLILNPVQGLPRLKRESELRRPSGDTQRLPQLGPGRPRSGA